MSRQTQFLSFRQTVEQYQAVKDRHNAVPLRLMGVDIAQVKT